MWDWCIISLASKIPLSVQTKNIIIVASINLIMLKLRPDPKSRGFCGQNGAKAKKKKKPEALMYQGFRCFVLIIPTRRVKSISKLFCIEDLIRRGFL